MRELILSAIKAAGGRMRESELEAQVVESPSERERFYGALLCLEDERMVVQEWPYLSLVGSR